MEPQDPHRPATLSSRDRVTAPLLRRKKERGEKIVMVTCYDFAFARLLDESGVDSLLVGDSLGDNVLGYENTLPVTMDDMVHHAAAVRRGARRALVVADMPFLSYQISADDAVRNAGRLIKEAGVGAVKLEGGAPIVATARRLVESGIPVMGHLGFTPQSIYVVGGYRVQGRDAESADRMIADSLALAEAGVFAIVLELIPPNLAARVTQECPVPTIGIGAGPHCDGQVQVLHDVLGLNPGRALKHVRRYAEIGEATRDAVARYASEVRCSEFPPPVPAPTDPLSDRDR